MTDFFSRKTQTSPDPQTPTTTTSTSSPPSTLLPGQGQTTTITKLIRNHRCPHHLILCWVFSSTNQPHRSTEAEPGPLQGVPQHRPIYKRYSP
jgi:hypothetical protein